MYYLTNLYFPLLKSLHANKLVIIGETSDMLKTIDDFAALHSIQLIWISKDDTQHRSHIQGAIYTGDDLNLCEGADMVIISGGFRSDVLLQWLKWLEACTQNAAYPLTFVHHADLSSAPDKPSDSIAALNRRPKNLPDLPGFSYSKNTGLGELEYQAVQSFLSKRPDLESVTFEELSGITAIFPMEQSEVRAEIYKCRQKIYGDMVDHLENQRSQLVQRVELLQKELEKTAELLSGEKTLRKDNTRLQNLIVDLEQKIKKLDRTIVNLETDITKLKNSAKYKVGEFFVDVYHNPFKVFSIPANLYNLYKTKKREKIAANTNVITLVEKQVMHSDFGKHNVDVIVCVHNALEDVIACLTSLVTKKTVPFNLILVDDGSDKETKKYLQRFNQKYPSYLIRNEQARGYTVAANQGLKVETKAKYFVLLNSDTIVTNRWLDKLLACMHSGPNVGIVGPLSNAATWQSVPKVKDENGWIVNKLDNRITIEQMAHIVEKCSRRVYPAVPFVNGFCYMISGKVLEKVGYLDEETFPTGYGEEDDFSLRSRKAGFELRIADDCYIFHQKSKSFTPQRRLEITKVNREKFFQKHSKQAIAKDLKLLEENHVLGDIREAIDDELKRQIEKFNRSHTPSVSIQVPKKAVIYTAITGNYDSLSDPQYISDEFDYVCFTDNPNVRSDVWKVVAIEDQQLDNTRKARRIKLLPHVYLPNYEYSIWVDGNIAIIDDLTELIDRYLKYQPIAFYQHSEGRNCIYEEADACIRLNKDDHDIIMDQMDKYRALGYPESNGLVSTGVIIRRHQDEKVIQTMEDWWNELEMHSRRDQLSFNFAAWKNQLYFATINEYIRDNRFFLWRPHDSKSKKMR